MAKIISIHSFRGGTGKSNTTASLAALIAAEGRRVGVIDTDIQSPGIHALFGLKENDIKHSLNEYLWKEIGIDQAAHNVTANLNRDKADSSPGLGKGEVLLIPSSMKAGEIARILREGCDVDMLRDGIQAAASALNLDVLLIDTHPGLNEETLLSIASSDALIIILRPDQQDYQGTRVAVEVARRLGMKRMMLLVNKTPKIFDFEQVKQQMKDTYNVEVAAVLPHVDDMMNLGSATVFVLRYPDHPVTAALRQIAENLMK
jgi:MinD-like ATPase involved in chromosome partitioning or flagellar assembly